ncbi:glycosyltransferase [Boudabousia liubingyangii]|uniref:Glycosyltransferase n=1 Tax=Boudabousia liubingyangii TaxID=1921764 RepID=A0A1Q5PPQ8_9ACTO|nr:glycosyltransferase family 2 protein [Boudabousia liubingyangii]OKL49527.1 glycosyltransferase [Boudabousia liubingyangii]
MSIRLSVVVPCYNEGDNLEKLCNELQSALDPILSKQWELILVDDGSKDHTAAKIRSLAAHKPYIHGLIFSRNFGKESAMLAGITASHGDRIVIMDGDLQHPPSLIPEMYQRMTETGCGQVIAKRNRKGDGFVRTLFSKLYYRLVNALTDVVFEDGAGDFRMLSRPAVDALLQLGEDNRFSKGLFVWIGFPTETIEYENVSREAGQSAWTPAKLINYAVDGVVSFNVKPLRIVIYIGGLTVFLAFLYVLFLIGQWAIYGISVPGYITTIAVLVGLSGIQFLALGVIGEYVGRIYKETKQRPHYIVAIDTQYDPQKGAAALSQESSKQDVNEG